MVIDTTIVFNKKTNNMKQVTRFLGALLLTGFLAFTSPVIAQTTTDNTTTVTRADDDDDLDDDDGDGGRWGLLGLLGLLGLMGLKRRDRDDDRTRTTVR